MLFINGHIDIQSIREIARSISGSDLGPKKKDKKLYKHRSGNKSFSNYSHFYVKKLRNL